MSWPRLPKMLPETRTPLLVSSLTVTVDTDRPCTDGDESCDANARTVNTLTQTISGACETGAPDVSFSGAGIEGTVNDVACTQGTYSASVTLASGDGDKTVTITQRDALGNSSSLDAVFTVDQTAPTVTVTRSTSGAVNAPFDVTIAFSEDVTNFVIGDVAVTDGTATEASAFSTTGEDVYTATITPDANVTSVVVNVLNSVTEDAAGNRTPLLSVLLR